VKVFINYIKKITKQYLFWVSDLKHIIKSYVVKFTENKKKNIIDFKLQQQTLNIFLEKKFVKYSQKKLITVKITVLDQTFMT